MRKQGSGVRGQEKLIADPRPLIPDPHLWLNQSNDIFG
jgi:hypothetical protein